MIGSASATHGVEMTTTHTFVVGDASYDGITNALISKVVIEKGLYFIEDKTFSSSVMDFELDTTIAVNKGTDYNVRIGWVDNSLVRLDTRSKANVIYSQVCSETLEENKATLKKLKDACTAVVVDDDAVKVGFWSLTAQGPQVRERQIQVPTWPTIEDNYSGDVSQELAWLMDPSNVKGGSGKLILWYGPPGTGKTWAIRAMMDNWKKDYNFQYIIDPENFFGSSTSYMMDVIMNSNHNDYSGKMKKRWNLVILEDTGELLSADAKNRAGQGLSRLLNVVDGLIGQGINTTFLITTNEELDSLHPAVVRPGRCISKINFDRLNALEGSKWLEKRGGLTKVLEDKTVAELYAILNGNKMPEGAQAEEEFSAGVYL